MAKRTIKIGTLFSGIGAFEHALQQLGIDHEILFACDNGERELPLTYADLKMLTQGFDEQKLYKFCEDYINCIGAQPTNPVGRWRTDANPKLLLNDT